MKRDTILVIDDDADFREMVRLLLESFGFAVVEAADCTSGSAVLEKEKVRLHAILLDYFMPGMTPSACTNAIRQQAGAHVSVILVTAAADPATRAAEVGCARWLSKPFTQEQLRRTLYQGG